MSGRLFSSQDTGEGGYTVKTLFGQNSSDILPQSAHTGESSLTLHSLASDLLHIAVKIQTGSDIGTAKSVKKLLHFYFEKFENLCYKNHKHPDQVSLAKYAIASLVDESILNKTGDVREDWVSSPLTLEMFDDPISGENFFLRLEPLMENPVKNCEVLEVFYLCLSLGFRGRYHIAHEDSLQAVSANIMQAIETVKGKAPKVLSPAPNTPPGKAPNINPGIKLIIGSFLILVLSVFFYFVLMTLSSDKNPIIQSAVSRLEKVFYSK